MPPLCLVLAGAAEVEMVPVTPAGEGVAGAELTLLIEADLAVGVPFFLFDSFGRLGSAGVAAGAGGGPDRF